ncbi:MAG: hypothetical protein VB098_02540 [Petrimonas sp.]|nr:hypothetical protein [Petrimonas sp.]
MSEASSTLFVERGQGWVVKYHQTNYCVKLNEQKASNSLTLVNDLIADT